MFKHKRQQSQANNHTKRLRIPDVSVDDAVMVREYSKNTNKLSPAFVQKQTGPISYECALQDGRVVKRHLDQLIPRTIQEKRTTEEGPSRDEIPKETTTVDNQLEEPPTLRRSMRTTKPIERFHY